jgi:DNA polymerase I-like protein with 3'-5' exonuclease and polymerase domains
VAAKLDYSDKIGIIETFDLLTVDTEGVGPMMGFSVCVKGMPEGFYLPFAQRDTDKNLSVAEQKHVLKLLGQKTLIHHNAAHDVAVLEDAGVSPYDFWDTMLMAYWLNEEMPNYSLDWVSRAYGGNPKNASRAQKQIIEEEGWHAIPLEMMDKYSSNDAFITDELFWKLKPKFDEQFSEELWRVEQDFIRYAIIPMKQRGVRTDMDFIVKEYMRGDMIMNRCQRELKINPSSPLDLKKFLVDELGLPVLKHTKSCKKCYPDEKFRRGLPVHTHKGPPSFDKDAMKEYDEILARKDDDRAKTILTFRGWQKTNSSNYKAYMRLADSERVLRPNFKLHGTRTHRLSCEDPNLQQIPKSSDKDWNGGLKQAFIPREGFGSGE